MRNNTLEVVMDAINEGDEAIVLSQLIHDPHAPLKISISLIVQIYRLVEIHERKPRRLETIITADL